MCKTYVLQTLLKRNQNVYELEDSIQGKCSPPINVQTKHKSQHKTSSNPCRYRKADSRIYMER